MKKIIFLIICAFFYIEKSEAQNSLNTETNDIFYYYSLFIPGDAKVSRWPLWMTGISKNDMRKELLSIKSFETYSSFLMLMNVKRRVMMKV